ncbi:MAG: hypothetical protein IT281_06880 [Ignavibacteria bacterium]|nr:hypothetical protein [Ignavibacteria bacterium]MCC7159244.1 hypothetical protein [Ignavibacteria bacterium]
MQNNTVLLKVPARTLQNFQAFRIIRLFKYELIKILIFLCLFVASVWYVNTESKEYYNSVSVESAR